MLISLPVAAQRTIPRAGITMPWISYGPNTETLTKFGFSLGYGWEIPVGKWYVQPEVALIQKGCDFTYDVSNEHKLTTYYLQGVLPAKYFLTQGKTKLYALGGVAVGVGLFGIYQNNGDDNPVEFRPFPDSGDDTRYFGYIDHRLEVGAVVGVGIEVGKIVLDFRYEHGLTNLYTTEERGGFDNSVIEKARNRVLQFSVGVPLIRKK